MDELAELAREIAAEWQLELGEAFALSRYSFVAPAGDDAVLKVVPTWDDESDHEADALAFWGGEGAVRLLRHDRPRKAMLLERARPGTDLSEVPDDEATAAAIEVARRLWRSPPPNHPFRDVWTLVRGWLGNVSRAHPLIDAAEATFARLDPRPRTLVHGDFHHHNLLRHGERVVAIDAKAALGEPEFDVPSFLWNPLETTPTPERTERRIRAFVEGGLDEERIRAWTVVRGVYLSVPDHGEGEPDPDQLAVVRAALEP